MSRSSNNFEADKVVDTFMLITFIASLVISSLLTIYFLKMYCCMEKDASSNMIEKNVVESSVECVGKKKRILMEDHFNIVEAESLLLGRSAASSMDHGYLAGYIKCETINQQADYREV